MAKIAAATKRCDIEELERLTKIAKRVQELESLRKSISLELEELAKSVVNPALPVRPVPHHETGKRTSIRIEIDWKAAGVSREHVTIEERKASQALVSFLGEIRAALGEAAIEKLTKLKISRGPLVSRRPDVDFINRGNGSVYMHHAIPLSDYFVITHSGTTEKIDAIISAARLLGLKDAVRATRAVPS